MKKEEENKGIGSENPRKKTLIVIGCCGLLFITLVLALLVVIGLILQSYNDKKDESDTNQSADSTPVYFLDSSPPDYSVSESSEEKFNNLLGQKFDNSDIKDVKNVIAELKEKYPEGYYIIVSQTLLRPDEFKNWYTLIKKGGTDTIGLVIHEMTHTGGLFKETFLIEDKYIKVPDQDTLTYTLPTGDKLLIYISSPNNTDKKYLQEDKQTIFGTMDEMNAYIKSVRCDRAYEEYASSPENLSRQIYYLTLHLKYLREENPKAWESLSKNRGFAYTLMRLVAMAQRELDITKGKSLFNLDFEVNDNLDLFEENRGYLDDFLTTAEVVEFQNMKLTYEKLKAKGVIFNMETVLTK